MKVSDLKLLLENLPNDMEVLRHDSEWGSWPLKTANLFFVEEGSSWTYNSEEELISSSFSGGKIKQVAVLD